LSLLLVLVSRAGEVVSKEELISIVWPRMFVEESNLRVHVAGLRRVLRDGQGGHRYLINVPGRGYSFLAPVQFVAADPVASVPSPSDRPPLLQLPSALPHLFGRDTIVTLLCEQLPQRRLVTLVGPGGIGKTAVAVAVARRLAGSYRDGICFVDFSSIRDPALVQSTIVASLGLATTSPDVMPALLAYLTRRSMLLILDNCEHVVEIAATTAEQVSATAPDVHLLCTSREPLRAAGERVHRLQPLKAPSVTVGLTATEALTYPCIQLFVDRAAAGLHGFTLVDREVPAVAEICQRLDGIALAIELAAGRVAAFGVVEVAKRLDDRFRLLTSGRRTAMARHQTLSATLDWSFDLLPTLEQKLLCRLSIFAGEFSLDAAIAVGGHGDPLFAVDHVADLVAKSLLVAETRGTKVRYRLLDTTRLYGLEKLRIQDELPDTARRHAEYLRHLLAHSEADSTALPAEQWVDIYASQLANVRAALDWASSSDGDPGLLIDLTIGAVPLWVHLSLMSECRVRVRAALALTPPDNLELRMRLTAALGWSLMYAAGRASEIGTTWNETLELATRLRNSDYLLHAMWGVWISKLNHGDLDAALGLAKQMLELVAQSSSDADRMTADRLMGTTLHYRGDQNGARDCIERMFRRYASSGPQPRIARFHVDQQVTARYFLARILWLQGHVDQAVQAVERNLVEGRSLGQALSFCSTLGQAACPIALFTGDLCAARRHAQALIEHTEKHYGSRSWFR
jgi:predicted ATPase